MIKGIHHVSLKGSKEEYAQAKHFYGEVLGMKATHETEKSVLYDTGAGFVELGIDTDPQLPKGTIRHFALACDDVDLCLKTVKDAGFEVFMEAKDIVMASDPPFPARIGFCYGPMGEEIEFFCEK